MPYDIDRACDIDERYDIVNRASHDEEILQKLQNDTAAKFSYIMQAMSDAMELLQDKYAQEWLDESINAIEEASIRILTLLDKASQTAEYDPSTLSDLEEHGTHHRRL